MFFFEKKDCNFASLIEVNMVKKFIYVIGWSLGLLFASFPDMFKGKMNFNMSDLSMGEVNENYLYPLFMALSLFVADVCYVFEQEKAEGGGKHITGVLILVCVFLFGAIYSTSSNTCPCVGFIIAWIALNIMKLLKTNKCMKVKKPQPEGVVRTED